ncbi:MAG: 50S ribosomal protein L24 [Chitinispirillia bacterium]|jgi:large subunit ribosomal protein L24
MAYRLKKGDTVQIITGDNKGQTGKILKVIPDKGRVLVENRNIVKRHTKPTQKNQQGGILEKEAPIHISNLMLLCEKTEKPTRIGIRTLENGKRARYSKKSKELID